MNPSIGQIVHFVMPNGNHRPAIIVNGPFDESPGPHDEDGYSDTSFMVFIRGQSAPLRHDGYEQACNLHILLDATNDATNGNTEKLRKLGAVVSADGLTACVYSRPHDENDDGLHQVDSWHWPEREAVTP